ncbi:diguanylate cyclase [Alteromonas sp. ASW11-19]|uniref:diguanylate cyclase n=1 Tax=Alteromonas salexigens TaxID=2982530 RepID=A0ABT2VN84_9ALTE|nr:diguanylate cyclase [Alteromonas salexigens]MCU7554348.1 diguanylate cyclase [Alteromonas salexigens]
MICLLWLAVWQVGLLGELHTHASVWFPAAGLSFAALLVAGRSALLPLSIAAVLITFWAAAFYDIPLSLSEQLIAGLAFATAHLAPYSAGAWIVRRVSQYAPGQLPILILSFVLSALTTTLLATGLGMLALTSTGMMTPDEIAGTWFTYWIGDLAGVVVITPFFLPILRTLYPGSSFSLKAYLYANAHGHKGGILYAKALLNIAIVIVSMLLAATLNTMESAFAIFFLAVSHMWMACTESPLANVISLAFSSFLIAFLVALWSLTDYVMVYQFAIIVIASNVLFALALPKLVADNTELERRVGTDTLTSAASRDALFEHASHVFTRAEAAHRPVSVIIFDVDRFKQINDQHGHQAGDKALQCVCEAAREVLRPADILARFGGDEFVVLLPDTAPSVAGQIGQRLHAHINALTVLPCEMTISAGIASSRPGDTFEDVFERADNALYRAKHNGRNQTQGAATNNVKG